MTSTNLNREKMKKVVAEKRRKLVIYHSGILDFLTNIIEEEIKELKSEVPFGNIRLVAEIANNHLFRTPQDPRIKSIKSIIDKIERSNGRYTIENFDKEMSDIFRMRIRCNYLSDVKAIVERIRKSKPILETFTIVEDEDKIIENRIKAMIKPTIEKPEWIWIRLHSFVFKHKEIEDCPKIEIQIMTMLQDAWDKKDHYLFYESKRMGDIVSPECKIKMNAMSELLYVADEFFDLIQDKVVKEAKSG